MQMLNLITLKFGTVKQHIKVNSHTEFAKNLIRVHSAMNIYSQKGELLSLLQVKQFMGIMLCT